MKTTVFLTLIAVALLYSCAKDISNPQPADTRKPPSVVTLGATHISCDSAVLNGQVLSDNDAEITGLGIYWSRLPDPGAGDSVIECTTGTGLFSATVSGLNDSVPYYFRAFATNAMGTTMGEERSFVTLDKKVPFAGRLVSHSECLSHATNREILLNDSLSCAQYSFDAAGHILHITHTNAGFCCCFDSLSCEVTINNDTIFINEVEWMPYCNCLCLYDLDIEVAGVNAQAYVIKFIEPYIWIHDPLMFPVELSTTPTGSECIVRHFPPWY